MFYPFYPSYQLLRELSSSVLDFCLEPETIQVKEVEGVFHLLSFVSSTSNNANNLQKIQNRKKNPGQAAGGCYLLYSCLEEVKGLEENG